MSWWRAITRWRPWFWQDVREQELDRELRTHLDLETEEQRESGLREREADYAARRALGNMALVKEDTRAVWTWTWLERFGQDLQYAGRQLRQHPGFAAVAVLTMALGIGANTAVFSLINATLLHAPPYREPSRLVNLWHSYPEAGDACPGVWAAAYRDYRDRNRAFASIAGYETAAFDVTDGRQAERIDAVEVSSSLFETLGVGPLIGRTFTAAEERPDDSHVAVLSHTYWQQRHAGSPEVLGATLRLNERLYTIVGVMPPEFTFPATPMSVKDPPALLVPLAHTAEDLQYPPKDCATRVVARLGPGVSLASARQDVFRVDDELGREHPETYSGDGRVPVLEPLAAEETARTRPVLVTFAVAAGFVLLIACSNVANLLLGRAAARGREIALRSALGASTGRLIRQLLTEGAVLTSIGGVFGCLLAQVITSVAARVGPEHVPGLRAAEVDLTVLAFTLALSLLTGVTCGLAPAIRWSRPNAGEMLKNAGRQGGDSSRATRHMRSGLVVLETASAVLLLVCAGLLIRSFVEVLQVSPGFDPEGVLVARTSFNRERYPDSPRRKQVEQTIAERLRSLPGVTEVAVTTHLPLADDRTIGIALEGSDPHDFYWANNALVSGNYFSAMGIRLVRGRTFTDADSPEAPAAAVVNQAMAGTFWPGDDPIGKRILWGGRTLTIVGIAGDVRLQALDAAVTPTVYNSVYQVESGATMSAVFVIRGSKGELSRLGSGVREIIRSVDPGLPVFDVRTMESIVAGSLAARRFAMLLLAAFAATALALAVIGLYAVLSYLVAQRTSELGVRLALGAPPARLVFQVLGQGVRLAAAGVVIGALTGAVAATAMSTLLFGISPLDPAAFLVASTVLMIVALAASYVPARRAAGVDPLVALRSE
ncbi:MAG: FtsX-like permease family protein [Luteitalea sp.]|nr:FtsX-like permease family protein [Luteitalea sp.]